MKMFKGETNKQVKRIIFVDPDDPNNDQRKEKNQTYIMRTLHTHDGKEWICLLLVRGQVPVYIIEFRLIMNQYIHSGNGNLKIQALFPFFDLNDTNDITSTLLIMGLSIEPQMLMDLSIIKVEPEDLEPPKPKKTPKHVN